MNISSAVILVLDVLLVVYLWYPHIIFFHVVFIGVTAGVCIKYHLIQ
jgi:hypothetical protein